jgi:hypothetical protein
MLSFGRKFCEEWPCSPKQEAFPIRILCRLRTCHCRGCTSHGRHGRGTPCQPRKSRLTSVEDDLFFQDPNPPEIGRTASVTPESVGVRKCQLLPGDDSHRLQTGITAQLRAPRNCRRPGPRQALFHGKRPGHNALGFCKLHGNRFGRLLAAQISWRCGLAA